MKNNSYELWFYDVWGNEEDGFSANDRHCVCRDFVIPTMPKTYNRGTWRQFTSFVSSDKEILTALIYGTEETDFSCGCAGVLNESALSAGIDIDGDGEFIYLTEKNGRPLCELLLNEEEKSEEQKSLENYLARQKAWNEKHHRRSYMRTLINKLKLVLRNKYVWPGGYALILLMSDGIPICIDCGREEFRNILDSTKHQLLDGWQFVGAFVNWEDLDCFCGHCSKQLPAEYEEG